MQKFICGLFELNEVSLFIVIELELSIIYWNNFQTDGIHANDEIRPGSEYPETLSEATKILKGEYVLKVK